MLPSTSSTGATGRRSPRTCAGGFATRRARRTRPRRRSSPLCGGCGRPTASSTFKPWIYRIAQNAAIDSHRRSSRAVEVSMDAETGLRQSDQRRVEGSPQPEATLIAKERLDHLRGAFDELPEAQARVLVMRDVDGLSYREIGERLDMGRSVVEQTLVGARQRLESEYEQLSEGRRCVSMRAAIDAACGRSGRARRRVPARPPRQALQRLPAARARRRSRAAGAHHAAPEARRAAAAPLGLLVRRRRRGRAGRPGIGARGGTGGRRGHRGCGWSRARGQPRRRRGRRAPRRREPRGGLGSPGSARRRAARHEHSSRHLFDGATQPARGPAS